MDLLEIDDCITSMLFPFVTNIMGFETGVALTNTSEGSGYCMLQYSVGGPEEPQMVKVDAGMTKTFGLSGMAPGFQGFIDATCDFLGGQGFAFISNGFGNMGGPTAAQGYLAVPTERK